MSHAVLLAALAKEAGKALSERQIDLYRPYAKQAAFHAAGAQIRGDQGGAL